MNSTKKSGEKKMLREIAIPTLTSLKSQLLTTKRLLWLMACQTSISKVWKYWSGPSKSFLVWSQIGLYHWATLRHLLFQMFQHQIKQCNGNKQSYNLRHNAGVKTIYRVQPIAWCCSTGIPCYEYFAAMF